MAWNEPGGNGNDKDPKDPWGGGDQGPPDLDEALRKFQEKLGGIFGGGGGSGGNNDGVALSGGLLGVVLGIVLIAWGLLGFYQVDEQERGVVLRFGKYYDTVQPGLQWNPKLIDTVEVVNVSRVRSSSHREQMLTEDENIVEVNLQVQYTVNDVKDFVLKVRNPESSLQHATESALRHVVGSSEMTQVLTDGREKIGVDVQSRLQDYLDLYQTGIMVSQVTIASTQPPAEVQAAFDDVIKAREDEERLKNEAQAYANGIIPEARGGAQRMIEEANAYKEQVIAEAEGEAQRFVKLLTEYEKAPEVTRERLYIDAVESVLSQSSKVMVDIEGGNNMLYLPLDKIIGQGGTSASSSQRGSFEQTDIRELTNRVVEQLRRDNQSNRREGR